jgi:ADP-ribose pyrophosphatase
MKKTIVPGRVITLEHKKIPLPNGYIVQMDVIKHLGAALIVPFLNRDKVILLRQYRPVIQKYLYELPAGTAEKGETSLSCAKRELTEETGYAGGKFTLLGHIYPVPGYSTEKIAIFKAEKLKPVQYHAEEDEVISILTVNKATVRHMFKKGQMTDAKTICAFAMCNWI